ncbi:putative mediator of RNA polymerase II transcription subunit 26 [Microplitis demolitor]|uniref:putative mediator of RNA polymerase II transcription subunit 26 n=1 Tax=Microplitis demolitor TaxID=69319 RepID=UPI0004CCB240|nr:putative mediator of RNA polymerase II transcription subunit 26 [Microplitis demolitor]
MGKTRGVHETTPELRNRMVGMYEAGLGLREIAAAVNCSQRTVKRWLNRFDKEGTVETRERCGRKRATTSEQDEAIIRLATQTPITAAKAVLPALGLTCSVDTIRERLHKAGIHNWSPSRKHIQKIPLGDADGAAIQQAVWRPTGTLLGKKKSQKFDDSTNKSGAVLKKKILRRKVKSKNNDIDTESSTEVSKQQQSEQTQQLQQDQLNSSFNFQPDNLNQVQQPSQTDENTQIQGSSLMNSQPEFSNALSLVVSSQSIYQHHPVDVTQNWPLDLGQSSHHYPQSQTQTMTLHQSSSQQHLQELHTPQEQEQRAAEAQNVHDQHMQDHNHSIQQLNHHQQQQHHHHHHHPFDQPQHQLEQIQPQLQQLQTREPSKVVRSNSCSNSSNDNSSDNDNDLNKDSSKECDDNYDRSRSRKKKGGKAKGTLETSVEIRNRMIGMSEAGLSTLSIALAINRSERTVKRWLERWNKEGNVQTKERKGRRRITTKEQDAAIVAMATQNPLTAAKHVAPALGLNCSVDTIRERLHKAGIHSWKLGKKQGEGNAVHTVHLWQPSGNRPNKPKIINNDNNNKKKKTPDKKVNSGSNNVKRSTNNNNNNTNNNNKKKKTDEAPKNVTPTSGSIICNTEQNSIQQYHDNSGGITYPSAPSMMQPVHIPQAQSLVPQQPPPPQPQAVPAPLVSIPPPPSSAIPQATSVPHSMQPLGPIMQRPDCRMISSIPTQNSAIIGYSSCMVGNNNPMDHQPDPLNYEPFIWSF